MPRVVTQPPPSRVLAEALPQPSRSLEWVKQAGIVISASLFVALCARVTLPLPFTPVPLTLQNFGVLAIALILGPRRGLRLSPSIWRKALLACRCLIQLDLEEWRNCSASPAAF